ncbi:MAG: RNA methyltransferase [Firmicutes bacterium]|nr:RNA methyltransferase [Bacillota bacterium]
MEWLTSPHNARVKAWAGLKEKKYRDRTQTYLVEGLRAVQTYCDSGASLEAILLDPYGERAEEREAFSDTCEAAGIRVYALPGEILARVTDTEHPQGVAAVARMPRYELSDLLTPQQATATCKDVLVIADGIRDPGNLGTLIRTADAVGARAVLTVEDTADAYQPKVVRAAMGSLAHIPVLRVQLADLLEGLQSRGYRILAADTRGGESVFESDLRGPIALAIGSEAQGLSETLLAGSDLRLSLPMPGQAESLNASIAAAVMLYEALRQRTGR